jgi:hypothetical protein
MLNIPNKHVGIFCDGLVFHYSSRQCAVVTKRIAEFQEHFDEVYGGRQWVVRADMPRPLSVLAASAPE